MTTELEDQVKNRAYEIWESEGRPSGRELDHWQQAIAELNEVAVVQATEASVLSEASVKPQAKDKSKAAPAKAASASAKPKSGAKSSAPKPAPAQAKPQRRSTRAQVTLN